MKILTELVKQSDSKNINHIGMIEISELKYNMMMGEDAALDYIADIAQECNVAQELLTMISSNQKLN